MNEKTKQILDELYSFDDSLRDYETNLIEIIEELLQSKPDTKFNAKFAQQLKNRLLSEKVEKTTDFTPVSWLTPNFLKVGFGFLVIAVLFVAGFSLLSSRIQTDDDPELFTDNPEAVTSINKFESDDDYVAYIEASRDYANYRGVGSVTLDDSVELSVGTSNESAMPVSEATKFGNSDGSRVSQTNVQVLGIDEPDMVKTNGDELFISYAQNYWIGAKILDRSQDFSDEMMLREARPRPIEDMPSYQQPDLTQIIDITDPNNLEILDGIKENGDLLLDDNILMIFNGDKIIGYDVSDRDNAKQEWDMKLNETYVVTSRLYNGLLYVVTQSYNNDSFPCPLQPFEVNNKSITVPCTSIYHPDVLSQRFFRDLVGIFFEGVKLYVAMGVYYHEFYYSLESFTKNSILIFISNFSNRVKWKGAYNRYCMRLMGFGL